MKILGLDISSRSTGWAVLDDGYLSAPEHCGIIKLKAESHGERLVGFGEALDRLLEQHKPDVVAVEDLWGGKFIQPLMALVRYRGVVEAAVWRHFEAEPVVHTATNFRKVLGQHLGQNLLPGKKEKIKTGKDSKMMTFEALVEYFGLRGFEFKTHNDITDALCVALSSHLILAGQAQLNAKPPKTSKPPKPKPTKSKKKR